MATTSNKKCKIFVAGIPSSIPNSEILRYFSEFGGIEKLDRSMGNSVSSEGDLTDSRGHCILLVRDKAAMERILSRAPHYVGGRKVMCKEYLEGSQLFRQNLDNNRRRVIIKKVPAQISEEEFRRYLTTSFGKIELMFCFRPEARKASKSERRLYRSYSVMFKEVDSASRATLARYLNFANGQSAIVEKFSKAKQTARQNWQSEARKKERVQVELITIRTKRSKSFTVDSGLGLGYNLKASSRAYSTGREEHYDRSGCKRYQFASQLVAFCSQISPTKKLYSMMRQEDFSYLASFKLKNCWSSLNNHRFNISSSQ